MYYPAGLVVAAEELSTLLHAPSMVQGPSDGTQAKAAHKPAIHPEIFEHLQFALVQDKEPVPEIVEAYARLVSSYEGVVQSDLRMQADYEAMQELYEERESVDLGFPSVLRLRMMDPLEDPDRIRDMFCLWVSMLKWCGKPEISGKRWSMTKMVAKDMRMLAHQTLERVNGIRQSKRFARIRKERLNAVRLLDNPILLQGLSTGVMQLISGPTVALPRPAIFPGWITSPSAFQVTYHAMDFKKLAYRIAQDIESKPDAYALERQRQRGEVLRDDLSYLIGLKSVKEEIRTLRANLLRKDVLRVLRRKIANAESASNHLVFVGPPGTAKTTIARETGQIYKSLGILKKGHVVEVKRHDLMGKYIGHTGPKTQAVIEKAYDGILFIDEAYDLFSASQNDFGHEAITQIMAAMENERHRLIVIMAGYPTEMKQMLQSNPGLASRFGQVISFPAYTLDELGQIFEQKMAENNLSVSKPSLAAACERIAQEMRDAPPQRFGNGRYVRNLVHGIEKAMSVRLLDSGMLTPEPINHHETPAQSLRRQFGGSAIQALTEPTPADVWNARIVDSNNIEESKDFGFVPKTRGPSKTLG